MIDLALTQLKSLVVYGLTHPRQVVTVLIALPLTLVRHAPELWERVRARVLRAVLEHSVRNRK